MKLNQMQLKHFFTNNKTIFFIRIDKLNSKKLLFIKKKLFKHEIKFKFFSKEYLNFFFFNFKNHIILNLFKGNVIILSSKSSNWLDCYNKCRSILSETKSLFYCTFVYSRFFFLSNLVSRNKNISFYYILKKFFFNFFYKTFFLQTFCLYNLIKKNII